MLLNIVGIRQGGRCFLYLNGREVVHKVKHSPTGMEWGYGGSGPADTARSILLMELPEEKVTPQLYQKFKAEFVATWQGESIRTIIDLDKWLKKIQGGEKIGSASNQK